MAVLLLASVLPFNVQANENPSVRITTHWVGQGNNDAPHAYLLTFSDNGSYGIEVDMEHTHNGSLLNTSHAMTWGVQRVCAQPCLRSTPPFRGAMPYG